MPTPEEFKYASTRSAADLDGAALGYMHKAQTARLAQRRAEGYSGWYTPECTQQQLSNGLHNAVRRGSLIGIANYAVFLHARDEALLPEKYDG